MKPLTLEQFFERLDGRSTTKELTQLFRISRRSLQRYLSGETTPAGVTKMRAFGIAHELGYEIDEFKNFHQGYRTLIIGVALDITTMEEAAEAFGCNANQHPVQRLMAKIKRHEEMTEGRKAAAHQYLSRLEEGIPAARTVFEKQYSHLFTVSEQEASEETANVSELQMIQSSGNTLAEADLMLHMVATVLQSTQPLLEWLQESATPTDRDQFRRLIGQRNLFNLSNLMTNLCSETAHRERKSV